MHPGKVAGTMKIEGRGEEYGVLHFSVSEKESLISFAERMMGVQQSELEKLVWLGALYINDVRVFELGRAVSAGDHLRLHASPRRFARPEGTISKIVYSDSDLLIFDKPSGIPVHPLTDNARENLLGFLEEELGERLFITHRLDIETSGLLIIAKNLNAQRKINALIADRKVKRLYRAWIPKPLEVGSYVHYMRPSPKAPKQVAVEEQKGWLRCQLTIRSCKHAGRADVETLIGHVPEPEEVYKLEVELQTGRSQQIRAQLAALGAPIFGDRIYGSRVWASDLVNTPRAICLRAFSLEFDGLKLKI